MFVTPFSSTGSSQGGTKVVAPQNQQFVYTTIPRQYSGARSGVLTHVSCTVDARQIEAAQSEALKNSTKGFSCIECGLPFLNMQALRAHAQTFEAMIAAEGIVGVSPFRQQAGIGRNLAVEVLEYFDRIGLSRRDGNARHQVRSVAEIFGD